MENKKYPVDLGYRMPAEWEKHEATWIAWPHNKEDWPGKFSPVKWVYAEIVKKILPGETVRIIVESEKHRRGAQNVLQRAGIDLSGVEFFKLPTNRGWLRDAFPQFIKRAVKDNSVAAVNFNFNAWAKYSNFKKDRKIPEFISKKFNLKTFNTLLNDVAVVLEGGSIDTNGKGTLLTTEECLMDSKVQARNPGFTKKDYEEVFKKYLGIKNVLWLGKGIAGDDTHGHVDDLCRFVQPDTVVLAQEYNPHDDNYFALKENKERLEGMFLEDGSKIKIVELPMPSPLFFDGQRLPASYANFYITNSAVLVPTFNDPKDKIAIGMLSELLSGREVIGVHSVDLVWGLGTIHCLTHEQPA